MIDPSICGNLIEALKRYKITNPIWLAHFFSQTAHESDNFKCVFENLNYSADALLRVFPKYFKNKSIANEYAYRPLMIGSRVYADRMGNGSERSQEGFKFRGRGYLQLSGKNNYKIFSDFISQDCVDNPDLVAYEYPIDNAIWFFNYNNLWTICDRGSSDSVVLELTQKINGGTNGLQDRLIKFKMFESLFIK